MMLIKLTQAKPKLGPVSEIADLLGINYENAKTICRRYKHGTLSCAKSNSKKIKKKRRTPASQSNGDEESSDDDPESLLFECEQPENPSTKDDSNNMPSEPQPQNSHYLEQQLTKPYNQLLPLVNGSRYLQPARII